MKLFRKNSDVKTLDDKKYKKNQLLMLVGITLIILLVISPATSMLRVGITSDFNNNIVVQQAIAQSFDKSYYVPIGDKTSGEEAGDEESSKSSDESSDEASKESSEETADDDSKDTSDETSDENSSDEVKTEETNTKNDDTTQIDDTSLSTVDTISPPSCYDTQVNSGKSPEEAKQYCKITPTSMENDTSTTTTNKTDIVIETTLVNKTSLVNGTIPTLNTTNGTLPTAQGLEDVEIMVPGLFPKKGSQFECVVNAVNSGMTFTQAAKECGVDKSFGDMTDASGRGGLNGILVAGGSDQDSAKGCSETADPRGTNPVAEESGTSGTGGASGAEGGTGTDEEEEAPLPDEPIVDRVIRFLIDTSRDLNRLTEKIVGSKFEVQTERVPVTGARGKTGPGGDAGSRINCTEVLAFIKKCQDTNYQSPDCQKFKEGCKYDSKVALTNPDENTGCDFNVDPIEIKKIRILDCQMVTKPVGPGADPCGPKGGEGLEMTMTMTSYDPCKNTDAMRDPDQADASCPLTVITLPFSDLENPAIPCIPDSSGVINPNCTQSTNNDPPFGSGGPGPKQPVSSSEPIPKSSSEPGTTSIPESGSGLD